MTRSFDVTGAMSYGGYVVHIGSLESGVVKVGDHCTCAVDYDYRFLVAPNHTMTHLMNWAIRRVLRRTWTRRVRWWTRRSCDSTSTAPRR